VSRSFSRAVPASILTRLGVYGEGRTMSRKAPPAVSFRSYGGNAPENYERYFVPTIGKAHAEPLLDAAELKRGERVLDVACGTGIVTRLASERVGAKGSVAGLDVNPAMLSVARAVSPGSVEWHESSAESIPCPDGSFDAVLCSLGLQFIPDKPAALREMRRVLVDDGRIAIGTVGPIPPVFEIIEQALTRHVSPEVAAFARQVFSLHEHQELHDLAESAGLRSISVESRLLRIVLPPPAEFLWQYVTSTPLGGPLGQIDDDARAGLQHDVTAGLRSFVEDGALMLELNAVLTTARR
jgi:ubiquinone/menaquinone biosynthesis C-methylase UbiE